MSALPKVAPRRLLTLQQVQALLGGVNRSTITRYSERGVLPRPIKFSDAQTARIFYDAAEVEAAIERARVSA